MRARYADGRAAVFTGVEIAFTPDNLIIVRPNERTLTWEYADLSRSDDHNGRVVLRHKKPDTGERLMFDDVFDAELAALAPQLMKPRAQGVEGRRTVIALATLAWSLAGAFLIGIPFAADPMARAMPEKYRTQIADISWPAQAIVLQIKLRIGAVKKINKFAFVGITGSLTINFKPSAIGCRRPMNPTTWCLCVFDMQP